jgi:type I restriction enzyme, S subunit
MANKWNKQKLGDVCEINQSKRDNKWNYPIIEYIDISSVGIGSLIVEPTLISVKDAPSRAQRLVQDGDTIVSTVRPNRRSMLYIKSPKQNTIVSTGFAVLHPKKIDSRFLYYSVFNQEFTDYLTARADGSAYPAVSPEVILAAELNLPSIPEQRLIAGILGALDDKIELNRRMNAMLESMARAVFSQWFVEGEDVANWRIGKISDYAQVTSGKRPETRRDEPDTEFKFPLFGGGGIMAYTDKFLFDFPIILTGRVGTLGVIFRISEPCWPSDNTLILISSKPEYYIYLYFHLKQTDLEILNRGSTQPLLTQSDLQKIEMSLPSDNRLVEFNNVVSPMFAKIDINKKESQILENLRDALLPKLMRGEVRVKDI